MKKLVCSVCHEPDKPMDDTIKVEGHIFCIPCFDKHFTDESKLEGKQIEKELDPTICAKCTKDFGENELDKISIYPVCDDCKIEIKNSTFPTWVKAFLAAVAIITLTGFIWNWKFYTAYENINDLNVLVEEGDYTAAASLMTETSDIIPQVENVKILAAYYKGIDYLQKDESALAMAEFDICKSVLPPEYGARNMWQQAKIGVCFDNKDYQGFLDASLAIIEEDKSQPISLTAVSSAYACLYIDKNEEIYKQQSEAYLEHAKMIDDTSAEMKNYYNRIEHRLHSKTIITGEAFLEKFPNGWTKE